LQFSTFVLHCSLDYLCLNNCTQGRKEGLRKGQQYGSWKGDFALYSISDPIIMSTLPSSGFFVEAFHFRKRSSDIFRDEKPRKVVKQELMVCTTLVGSFYLFDFKQKKGKGFIVYKMQNFVCKKMSGFGKFQFSIAFITILFLI